MRIKAKALQQCIQASTGHADGTRATGVAVQAYNKVFKNIHTKYFFSVAFCLTGREEFLTPLYLYHIIP